MVVNKCLICDTNLESLKKSEIGHPSNSFLSRDLDVIFVLRNLFDIPREKVESYLAANYGHPSEWNFVSFCGHCGEAVENAKRIYLEVLDATKIFTAVKQEIVETVRRHWRRRRKDSGSKELSSRKSGGSMSSTSDKITAKIVDETRKFIHDHDYGFLADKDPFVDGDLQARNLSAKLSRGSKCHERAKKSTSVVAKAGYSKLSGHVKKEPMTSDDENELSWLYMSPNDLEVDSELHRSNGVHAEPVVYENSGEHSSKSMKSKRTFFKVKDFKNQLRKKIQKSGPKSFVSETSKIELPKRKYQCELENCGRVYQSKDKLARHQLNHYDDYKPLHCDWPTCNSTFKTAFSLRRHKLLHSVKSFKCGFCDMKFPRKGNLRNHMKRIHFTT